MKPFDLEAALRGEPLITRDGRKVLDFHYFKEMDTDKQCIVYHAENSPLRAAYIKGNCIYSGETDHGDLFINMQKIKQYIAVSKTRDRHGNHHLFLDRLWDSQQELIDKLRYYQDYDNFTVLEIEIEV